MQLASMQAILPAVQWVCGGDLCECECVCRCGLMITLGVQDDDMYSIAAVMLHDDNVT